MARPNLEGTICMKVIFYLSYFWREFSIGFQIEQEYHLLDPQSVFNWSKILMAVPQRSGLESCGHKVTVGKTILSIGKVSTFDFMGFSIQPASTNLIFIFVYWFQISVQCPTASVIIVFCCIAAWIQPNISGCQQDFLVVWRWNQLRTF